MKKNAASFKLNKFSVKVLSMTHKRFVLQVCVCVCVAIRKMSWLTTEIGTVNGSSGQQNTDWNLTAQWRSILWCQLVNFISVGVCGEQQNSYQIYQPINVKYLLDGRGTFIAPPPSTTVMRQARC